MMYMEMDSIEILQSYDNTYEPKINLSAKSNIVM